MVNYRKRLFAATAAVAMAAGLAACGGGGSDNESPSGDTEAGAKGGTLQYYIFAPYEHVDPQRTYLGVDHV
jgi:peptide/nickel transport system substrate-binding protein